MNDTTQSVWVGSSIFDELLEEFVAEHGHKPGMFSESDLEAETAGKPKAYDLEVKIRKSKIKRITMGPIKRNTLAILQTVGMIGLAGLLLRSSS